ncbi:MAG TPA: hypothetical protein VEP89_00260, partial [Draconibacterium sp.]|nr:hypothetical protein [Draconibacterium sp.]
LHVINLCGDKLFEYPSFDLLISELNQYNVTKRIYLKLEYLPRSLVKLMRWKEEIDQVKISIDPDFDLEKLLYFFNLIENANIECFWQFNISSELNYNEVEDFIDMYKLENYEILPFFNGNNYDFFEEFVFLTEEEIQCNQLTKREIFAHQVLNTNNFGKLTLKADGNVYANIHQPPLGTINDSVNEMICKELNSTSSWLRIRNNILPCSNCLYKWLCPSPSDYEHVIGKPNLCHVIT